MSILSEDWRFSDYKSYLISTIVDMVNLSEPATADYKSYLISTIVDSNSLIFVSYETINPI